MEKSNLLELISSFTSSSIREIATLTSNSESLNKDIIAVAELISSAQRENSRIHFTGVGKPSYVARYMASLLSSTGSPAYFLDTTETIHGSSGQVRPNDIVIAISNSGQTIELQLAIKTLIKNGAYIIGVSGDDLSWLALNSNRHLFAGISNEGDRFNKAPRCSIIAEILILQCLSIALQELNHLDIKTYLKWHPGGSIGESIRKE